MTRRQVAEHLRNLDEATVRSIKAAHDGVVASSGMLGPTGEASLLVAVSNLAVATAIRGVTGYVADGLDKVAEATRAVARRPDPKPDHQLAVSLDRIAQALEQPARQDPRARIRAARRTNRRSTR